MSSASAEVAARIARLEEELLLAKEVSAAGRGAASGTAEMLRVERELAAARAEIAGARGGSETADAARANAGAGPIPAKATATTEMAPRRLYFHEWLRKRGIHGEIPPADIDKLHPEYMKELESWKSQYGTTHHDSGHPKPQKTIDFEYEITHNRREVPPSSAADAARGNAGAAPAPATATPVPTVNPNAPRPPLGTPANPVVPPTVGTPTPVQTGLPNRPPLGSPANPRPAPTVGTPAPVPTGLNGGPTLTGTTPSSPYKFYDPRTWNPVAQKSAATAAIVGAGGMGIWAIIKSEQDRVRASGAANAGTGPAGTGASGTPTAVTPSPLPAGSGVSSKVPAVFDSSNGRTMDSNGRIADSISGYNEKMGKYPDLSAGVIGREQQKYFNDRNVQTAAQHDKYINNEAQNPNSMITRMRGGYYDTNGEWQQVTGSWDKGTGKWTSNQSVQAPSSNLSSKSKIGTIPQEDIDGLIADQSIANINRYNAKHGENAHLKVLRD